MDTINIAYYNPEDWEDFLKLADDREDLEDTWAKWYLFYKKTKDSLIADGFIVRDFIINLDELVDYCIKNKVKNTSETRSQFVAKK